jgi:hypothetical protein
MQLGLNCSACDETMQKERGCTEDGIVPFLVGENRYTRCPIKLITRTTWDYIKAYKYHKMGLLPNGISYMNESQKYLDAMTILDNEVARIEEAEMKKAKHGRR